MSIIEISPHKIGSKAKLADNNAAPQTDVLELADSAADLYLSEIDDPQPTPSIKSVVVKVPSAPTQTVSSNPPSTNGRRFEHSVSNGDKDRPTHKNERRQATVQHEPTTDLFPNRPTKLPPLIDSRPPFDSRYRIPRKAPPKPIEIDSLARKRSSQGRHTSDHRRERKPHYKEARTSRDHEPTSQSLDELKQKRERLRIAIQKVKSKPALERRAVKFIGPSLVVNSNQPAQRSVQIIGSPFTRLEPATTRREYKEVAVQTEPCRCQRALKVRNKKRREQAKLNRDIVRRMQSSEI